MIQPKTLSFVKVAFVESNIVHILKKVADNLLELVHSDVCGKISERSMGGAQYFLTFTDHKSRYSWTCFLKPKDEVFYYFLEWKSMLEKAQKY